MKKFLIATNLFLLAAVIFFACRHQEQPTNRCTQIVSDFSNQPGTGKIFARFARAISQNYQEDLGKKFIWKGTTQTKQQDAYSISFKLSVLKQFIWEIESRACKQGCGDTLGIRFYYARYPEKVDPIWADAGMTGSEGFENHHTLFGVPAYYDVATNKYVDYDPFQGCRKPFDLSLSAKPSLFLFAPGEAQNHGGLRPPPDSTGTFPTTADEN